MELWLEYLVRHKLEKHIPKQRGYGKQIIVRRSYMNDWQMWMYFLNTYRPIIQACEPCADRMCSIWTRDWVRGLKIPTLTDQKSKLFQALPYLETVWDKWQQHMFRSRSDMSDMTI